MNSIRCIERREIQRLEENENNISWRYSAADIIKNNPNNNDNKKERI